MVLIYITNTENQSVRVEFTDEELQHQKFHQYTNGIMNKYDGELKGNIMSLYPKKAQKKDNLGILIDDIREDLLCDVLLDEDPKKDKNKCATFSFTKLSTQEPPIEPEPELIESIKDKKDKKV